MSWSPAAEAAYRKRVSDIGLRMIAYTRWMLANETFKEFPQLHRLKFEDAAYIAIGEGEKAHEVPNV